MIVQSNCSREIWSVNSVTHTQKKGGLGLGLGLGRRTTQDRAGLPISLRDATAPANHSVEDGFYVLRGFSPKDRVSSRGEALLRPSCSGEHPGTYRTPLCQCSQMFTVEGSAGWGLWKSTTISFVPHVGEEVALLTPVHKALLVSGLSTQCCHHHW